MKVMKYEAPELTVMLPAFRAIQNLLVSKSSRYSIVETAQPGENNEPNLGYADWE